MIDRKFDPAKFAAWAQVSALVAATPGETDAARLARELAEADAYTDELEAEARELEAENIRLRCIIATLRGENDRLARWRDTLLLYLGATTLVAARLRGR